MIPFPTHCRREMLAAVFVLLSSGSSEAIVVWTEDFNTDPLQPVGDWSEGSAQSGDSTLSWDSGGERLFQSNPGTNIFQVTDTHNFDAANKVTLTNDGEMARFTIDFEINNALAWMDFMLYDDAESFGAGVRVNRNVLPNGELQEIIFGSASAGLSSPILASTPYTAVVEVAYSGGMWTSAFSVSEAGGGPLIGSLVGTAAAGAAPRTFHAHMQTVTINNVLTQVYYDNATLEFFPVPEPGAAVLVMLGCGVLSLSRRRRG